MTDLDTDCFRCRTARAECSKKNEPCCDACEYGDTHRLYTAAPPERTVPVDLAVEAGAAALYDQGRRMALALVGASEADVPPWGLLDPKVRDIYRSRVRPYIEGVGRS